MTIVVCNRNLREGRTTDGGPEYVGIRYRYRIAENLRGRKFSRFVAIRESFLCEIWGLAFFGAAKASNPRKFSPQNRIFTNSQKFSPSKVSRCTVFGYFR